MSRASAASIICANPRRRRQKGSTTLPDSSCVGPSSSRETVVTERMVKELCRRGYGALFPLVGRGTRVRRRTPPSAALLRRGARLHNMLPSASEPTGQAVLLSLY